MKRGILLALCIIYLSPFILGFSGVSPASFSVDFEPNLKKEFVFTFSSDAGTELEAYINEAPLSKYLTIKDETYKLGKKVVIVELKLPAEAEIPGLHRLRIGTRPIFKAGSGVNVVADAGGIIKLRIPYPGKYAEVSLDPLFANAGEDVPYKLTIHSRGEEDIFVQSKLEIRDINSNLVDTIYLEDRTIKSKEGYTYTGLIKTVDYQPGDYNLTAVVEFGGESPTIVTALFRLGELRIAIINFTKEVEAEKLNRFKMKIESFWNDPIPGVYGTIRVVGYPEKTVQTPSLTIDPWEETYLIGFIDTTGIESNVFQAQLKVFYANKTTTEIVEVEIIQETNWLFIVIVAGSIVVAILVLSLIIFIIILLIKLKYPRKEKKTSQKKEKNKK